jgi:hypothetical protein
MIADGSEGSFLALVVPPSGNMKMNDALLEHSVKMKLSLYAIFSILVNY